MPEIIISANNDATIQTSKKHLEFLHLSAELMIEIPGDGNIIARVNKTYDVTQHHSLRIINNNDFAVSVRYENRNTTVNSTGNPAVAIEQAVQISDIAGVVNVTGHVEQTARASTATRTYDDVLIAGHQKTQLIAANPNRKELIIQVISDVNTIVRIGDSEIADNRGLIAFGTADNPNILAFDHQSEIWCKNTGAATAKMAIMEVLQ